MNKEVEFLLKNNVFFNGVIHIGAHRGEELAYYKEIFKAKKIILVEANPEVYKEMLENIKNLIDENVLSFNLACSDSIAEDIEFNIIYGEDAGFLTGNKGCSSILNIDYENVIKANNLHHFLFKKKIMIKNKILDNLLIENSLNFSDYNFLNIDTQGAEMKVLNGARKLLSQDSLKYVFLETTFKDPFYEKNCTFEEIKHLLSSYNFNYKDIFWHSQDKWGDALFIKQEKK